MTTRALAYSPLYEKEASEDSSLKMLMEMLTYKRPHKCRAERKFINRFLMPYGVQKDEIGNLYKRIGTAPIMWSTHTDTVHDKGGRQYLIRFKERIAVSPLAKSNCLGADDTAGVWLALQMMDEGVEGLYVFHRGEEIGMPGSTFIAKDKTLLKGIEAAIALDRAGNGDVITQQRGERCCSDEFATSLADALGMGHKPAEGVFTDTANYVDDVGECSNLSVGYKNQHGKNEWLDADYIQRLRDRLCTIDLSQLTFKRKPGEVDPADRNWSRYGNMGSGGGWSWEEYLLEPKPTFVDFERNTDEQHYNGHSHRKPIYNPVSPRDFETDLGEMTMLDVVSEYPDEIAEWLEEHMSVDEVLGEIERRIINGSRR